MNKIMIILFIILLLYVINTSEKVIVPENAIRMRVLANSNNETDQTIKKKVSIEVQKEIASLLKNVKNNDEARSILTHNIDYLSSNVGTVLKQNNSLLSYSVDYGNHYFPKKEYKGVVYEEGAYESLLVTLGKGEGDNWWCVLFPPLCLLEAEESDEVEYKFFVQELIDKWF